MWVSCKWFDFCNYIPYQINSERREKSKSGVTYYVTWRTRRTLYFSIIPLLALRMKEQLKFKSLIWDTHPWYFSTLFLALITSPKMCWKVYIVLFMMCSSVWLCVNEQCLASVGMLCEQTEDRSEGRIIRDQYYTWITWTRCTFSPFGPGDPMGPCDPWWPCRDTDTRNCYVKQQDQMQITKLGLFNVLLSRHLTYDKLILPHNLRDQALPVDPFDPGLPTVRKCCIFSYTMRLH